MTDLYSDVDLRWTDDTLNVRRPASSELTSHGGLWGAAQQHPEPRGQCFHDKNAQCNRRFLFLIKSNLYLFLETITEDGPLSHLRTGAVLGTHSWGTWYRASLCQGWKASAEGESDTLK